MKDYSICYREEVTLQSLPQCDIFLSAFNASDRVHLVYDHVRAQAKQWIVFPEYGYTPLEQPADAFRIASDMDEAEAGISYLDRFLGRAEGASVCVDITGFIRPHLVFLLAWCVRRRLRRLELLYAEPDLYIAKENTQFSKGAVSMVRQICGCEGSHDPDTSNDVLIIASGYDHELIAHAAEHKNNAKKIQILGFPSLRPEMYQENVLRADLAAEAIGGEVGRHPHCYFAQSNNPFATAEVVSRIVAQLQQRQPITNLYLCPLSSKPQAVGLTLFFLWECAGTSTSIIFPMCDSYSRETSEGIARIWSYTVELP